MAKPLITFITLLSLRLRACGYVRLLGPCFKTGYLQHTLLPLVKTKAVPLETEQNKALLRLNDYLKGLLFDHVSKEQVPKVTTASRKKQ
jgi:hypothetical protein